MISLAASPPADSGSGSSFFLFISLLLAPLRTPRVKPIAVEFPTCRRCSSVSQRTRSPLAGQASPFIGSWDHPPMVVRVVSCTERRGHAGTGRACGPVCSTNLHLKKSVCSGRSGSCRSSSGFAPVLIGLSHDPVVGIGALKALPPTGDTTLFLSIIHPAGRRT